MNQRDPKFVVGGKPVNRRTASRQGVAAAPQANPLAQERLLAARARTQLGAPLAEQLRAAAPRRRRHLSRSAAAGGMAGAAGATALFLGWLQSSVPLLGVGLAAVAAGLALGWKSRRSPSGQATLQPASPLLAPESVDALDRALEAMALELPPALAQELAQLKQLLVRIARHPAAGGTDEHFTLEDRLYVNECVRRYLPDSLQSYMAVPRAQRGTALADGQSPQGLLQAQLALLRGELEQRETRLARSASEALLQQQRFLKSKGQSR